MLNVVRGDLCARIEAFRSLERRIDESHVDEEVDELIDEEHRLVCQMMAEPAAAVSDVAAKFEVLVNAIGRENTTWIDGLVPSIKRDLARLEGF